VGGEKRIARSRRATRNRALSFAEREGDSPGRVRLVAHLLHKWTMRTCFNAQEEIYQASMEEVEQVRARFRRWGAIWDHRATFVRELLRQFAPRARTSAA